MSKKKRSQRSKQSNVQTWSDLEQEFFASAPPDEPQPAEEAPRFDDLGPIELRRAEMPVALRRTVDAISRLITMISNSIDRRTITIAVATFMLLVGLSAAVFARH